MLGFGLGMGDCDEYGFCIYSLGEKNVLISNYNVGVIVYAVEVSFFIRGVGDK